MTARDTARGEGRPRPTHALLAAALLATTALVRLPTELYAGSFQDFASASRDLLLAVFAAGLLLFVLLALVVVCLPGRWRGGAGAALVGLAVYAWVRSGFFPGPSVNLDGSPVTADLSTGPAGLLVPLAGAAFLAWLGTRQSRVVTVFLAALLGGSLLQSIGTAASVWQAVPRASDAGVAPLLEWSRQGNVLILILDALQSDVFEDVLEAQPRLREELDGFRYYRLASSSSPTTYLSVPTIHSGRHYEPGRSVLQFYRDEVYEGSVLNRLADAGYRVSYAIGPGPCPRAVASCFGTAELARSRREIVLKDAAYLIDLGIYRVLPDGLRAAVLGRGQGLLTMIVSRPYLVDRAEGEAAALERLASSSVVTDGPPTAKMIHTMITHRPLLLQPDCSVGEGRDDREGAALQARCAFKRIVALLDRLEAGGVYDVSSIVVIADHGYGFESRFAAGSQDPKFRRMVGAFNPVVLVKPAGARGRLTTSDAAIELADLAGALCGEEGCSPADGLGRLEEIEAGRARPAFWYLWKHRYWGLQSIPGLTRYSIRGDLTKVEAWSREAALYTPGTVLDFRRGGNTGLYLGFGWGRRQPTQTWMVDARATLFLKVAFEPGRDYVLLLDGLLSGASPEATGRVTVEVNGVEIGELTPAGSAGQFKRYRMAIPRGVLSRSPQTTILFSAKEPGAGPGPDLPETRLGVQTLELRALP